MKIHFLTTRIVDASGGAKYDYNLFGILKKIYNEDVILYDDESVRKKCHSNKRDLLSFNKMYSRLQNEIADCDLLILNSRLYTRLMFCSLKKKMHKDAKLIIIHHHNNFMSHSRLSRMIHKHFEMKLLKSADQLIIPNIYVIDILSKDIDNDKFVHLESSFEIKEYNKSSLESKNLLFVGNVQERKGLLYGLKAFKLLHNKHPEYKYIIVGKYDSDDKYYQSLIRYVEENGLVNSVEFYGRVSDEQLDAAYSNADIFLFPSLLEGYGWVMIEAMGRGLPVVAFNNSAMPYTVKNGKNGLIVENMNSTEMGNALINLVEEKSLLLQLHKGAIETYNSVHSQEDLNRETEEFLRGLSK